MNDWLSTEALMWLESVNYTYRSYEEQLALIKAAKILFSNDEEVNQDAETH